MESNLAVRCFSFQSHFEIGADFCQVFKRVIVLHHAESQIGILDIKNKSPPANLILCPLNSTLVEIEKLDWKKKTKKSIQTDSRQGSKINFVWPHMTIDFWLNFLSALWLYWRMVKSKYHSVPNYGRNFSACANSDHS